MLQDHTFHGWFATGLYVAAAALCFVAARWPAAPNLARAQERTRLAAFWWLLGAGLVALAFNKQLDLQTTITDWLRDIAQRDGWYARRRVLQIALVAAALVMCGAGAWAVRWLLGRHWRTHRLALVGIGLLLAYLLLRVADIERLGEMTNMPVAARGVRDAIEWIALIVIAVAAWRRAVVVVWPPGRAGG